MKPGNDGKLGSLTPDTRENAKSIPVTENDSEHFYGFINAKLLFEHNWKLYAEIKCRLKSAGGGSHNEGARRGAGAAVTWHAIGHKISKLLTSARKAWLYYGRAERPHLSCTLAVTENCWEFQRSFNITETGAKQITDNLIANLRKLAKFRIHKFQTLPYLNACVAAGPTYIPACFSHKTNKLTWNEKKTTLA